MDGSDLGVSAIFRFIGRTDGERRTLLASIAPLWGGNQVWFILGCGAVFGAWPQLYAASFSGLCLVMLLLAACMLRPVGFTYRNKLRDPRWRNVWDWTLFAGGAVPALLFGVAIGNLFLGVPFHFDALHRAIYTGGFFELLHPYALLTGLVSVSMLVMHGSTYAALEVGEPMAERAVSLGRTAATTFIMAFLIAGLWVSIAMNGYSIEGTFGKLSAHPVAYHHVVVTPGGWLENYRQHTVLWMAPSGALLFALITRVLLGMRQAGAAFVSSSLTQAATILTAGFALFPFLMPSSEVYNDGLTVWNASSSERTLRIMLVAVAIVLPIALAYTTWVFRVLKGRMIFSVPAAL
jgi:cytochrome d ubiquinol oxidase subunit II